MNRHLLLAAVFWAGLTLLTDVCCAQITLGRQVISCLALNGLNEEISLNSTAGQSGYTTEMNGPFIITQGFEQPANRLLLVDYIITQPGCDNGLSWTFDIESLEGCGAGETEWTVFFQGSVVSLPLEGSGNDTLFLSVSAGLNCTAWLAVPLVYPTSDCFLVIPDIISPNGDNLNEYWHISGIELPEFAGNELRIFNRWGQTIWEGRNYDNEIVVFEGLDSNGNTVPDGTYFYELRTGGSTYEGYLEILR